MLHKIVPKQNNLTDQSRPRHKESWNDETVCDMGQLSRKEYQQLTPVRWVQSNSGCMQPQKQMILINTQSLLTYNFEAGKRLQNLAILS